MFPLKNKQIGGYRFGEPTFYSAKHLGTDYKANYVELYAPSNGRIVWEGFGSQGGNTIHFRPDGQDIVIRFMHLQEFKRGQEYVNEGELIAITGNTGSATTAAHLHTDVSKGSVQINNFNNFINPEDFNWGKDNMDVGAFAKQVHEWHAQYVRTSRKDKFGEVDEKGSEADIKLLDEKFFSGDIYELGNLEHRLMTSQQFGKIWVKRTEAQKTMEVEVSKSLVACEAKCATTVSSKDAEIKNLKADVDELDAHLATCQGNLVKCEKSDYGFWDYIRLAIGKLRKEK